MTELVARVQVSEGDLAVLASLAKAGGTTVQALLDHATESALWGLVRIGKSPAREGLAKLTGLFESIKGSGE